MDALFTIMRILFCLIIILPYFVLGAIASRINSRNDYLSFFGIAIVMILSHIIALFVDLRATGDFIEILIVVVGAIFAFVVGRLKLIIPLILISSVSIIYIILTQVPVMWAWRFNTGDCFEAGSVLRVTTVLGTTLEYLRNSHVNPFCSLIVQPLFYTFSEVAIVAVFALIFALFARFVMRRYSRKEYCLAVGFVITCIVSTLPGEPFTLSLVVAYTALGAIGAQKFGKFAIKPVFRKLIVSIFLSMLTFNVMVANVISAKGLPVRWTEVSAVGTLPFLTVGWFFYLLFSYGRASLFNDAQKVKSGRTE